MIILFLTHFSECRESPNSLFVQKSCSFTFEYKNRKICFAVSTTDSLVCLFLFVFVNLCKSYRFMSLCYVIDTFIYDEQVFSMKFRKVLSCSVSKFNCS